jgi:hypothetical protein
MEDGGEWRRMETCQPSVPTPHHSPRKEGEGRGLWGQVQGDLATKMPRPGGPGPPPFTPRDKAGDRHTYSLKSLPRAHSRTDPKSPTVRQGHHSPARPQGSPNEAQVAAEPPSSQRGRISLDPRSQPEEEGRGKEPANQKPPKVIRAPGSDQSAGSFASRGRRAVQPGRSPQPGPRSVALAIESAQLIAGTSVPHSRLPLSEVWNLPGLSHCLGKQMSGWTCQTLGTALGQRVMVCP